MHDQSQHLSTYPFGQPLVNRPLPRQLKHVGSIVLKPDGLPGWLFPLYLIVSPLLLNRPLPLLPLYLLYPLSNLLDDAEVPICLLSLHFSSLVYELT